MTQPKKRQNKDKASALSSEQINRTMPESLEAEVSVLGSMILDKSCISDVVQKIKAEAFYRNEHQLIFDAIVGVYEKLPPDKNVDLLLLKTELVKNGHFEQVGGNEYLLKIVDSVASTANVGYYCDIIKDNQLMRDLIGAATEILSDAYSFSGDIKDKLDNAERKVFDVTEKKMTGQASPINELLIEAFSQIEQRSGKDVTGLSTGYFNLDTMTSGLHGGEMIIIAGRPSMGKTSFAMNVAEHIGADEKTPVAIFSLEMSKVQLAERLLCSRGMVDSQAVRRGALDSATYQDLIHTSSELSEAPIFIDDTPGMTPLEIRAKARRLKAQHDIQCIVIDYLQLMSLGGRVESRQAEISTISRQIKSLARELDVPVMILSQLNRAAEQREDHKPRMSDLRESGSIEQDADVILLLHREDYYHKEPEYEPTNKAEVIIAKQRNGPTGTVELHFNGQFTRFDNLRHDMEDSPF
ncbi:MAG: replicative DNA helicase [Sedimentisphaeraceae bacterium JB056]